MTELQNINWIHQKELADKFAMSSRKMGIILTAMGIKKSYGEVSEEAIQKNIVKNFGESKYYKNTYKYNENLITKLLIEKGNYNIPTKKEREENKEKEKAKKLIKQLINGLEWIEFDGEFTIEKIIELFFEYVWIEEEQAHYIKYIKEHINQSLNENRKHIKEYQDLLMFCNYYLEHEEEIYEELCE